MDKDLRQTIRSNAKTENRNQSADQMKRNLQKTAHIIDAVFTLKLAWIKSRHAGISEAEAQRLVYNGILERKERQWMSHSGS